MKLPFPQTLHDIEDDEGGHFHLHKVHYIIIAAVLAIIVLAILFTPIGGSALKLPF